MLLYRNLRDRRFLLGLQSTVCFACRRSGQIPAKIAVHPRTRAGFPLTISLQRKHRIFLLSPANLAGIRAGYVMNGKADFDLACRLRRDGATLGELFSFVSGLYFRGKLAYARAFSAPPPDVSGAFVITASEGLVRPDTTVTIAQLREWATSAIDVATMRYRAALERDCRSLLERLGDSCAIVLLGSIATPKYVEPLLEIFGERLLFPAEFVGRGDMSRGGLMLRSAEAGNELTYAQVLNAIRHGKRPPKLEPLLAKSNLRQLNSRATPDCHG